MNTIYVCIYIIQGVPMEFPIVISFLMGISLWNTLYSIWFPSIPTTNLQNLQKSITIVPIVQLKLIE